MGSFWLWKLPEFRNPSQGVELVYEERAVWVVQKESWHFYATLVIVHA